VAQVKEENNSYRILMGKPVGRRPLGIPKCRWQGSIKWVVRKLNGLWSEVRWLRTGTVVKKVMNLWSP